MRKSWLMRGVAAVAASVFSFGAAEAQVFTPTFMAPRLTNDVGIYVSDFDPGFALEGIWRAGALGIRAGFVDVGDGALSLGGEIRNPVVLAGSPIGLAFTAGGQALLGDANALGLQAGFSAGHTFVPQGSNFSLTPYVHPRLAILNDYGAEDKFDLDLLADVGVNFDFAPNLSFRLGVNLGSGANWGAGVAWRGR